MASGKREMSELSLSRRGRKVAPSLDLQALRVVIFWGWWWEPLKTNACLASILLSPRQVEDPASTVAPFSQVSSTQDETVMHEYLFPVS